MRPIAGLATNGRLDTISSWRRSAAGCCPEVGSHPVPVARLKQTAVLIAAIGLGACRSATPVPFGPVPRSGVPTAPCVDPAEVPALDEPRFAPAVTGELALIRAEGDARLSVEAEANVLAAWSAGGELVTFIDRGAVTTWRAADGRLVDIVSCTAERFAARAIALSPDGRWVAVDGLRPSGYDFTTCIVDRQRGEARLVSGGISPMAFHPDGQTLLGSRGAIDLRSGARRAGLPAPRPSPASPGVTSSHDGRLQARWSVCPQADAGGGGKPAAAISGGSVAAPLSLELSEQATGKVWWRRPDDGDCRREWRFSPDDRFLEKAERADLEKAERADRNTIVDVRTGDRVRFPGELLPIAADGRRVVVLMTNGPQIWSVERSPAPIVSARRHRTVLARSRDGTAAVARDKDDLLVLERAGRCVPLGASTTFGDAIAFTPDGTEVYASLEHNDTMTFRVWRGDTGALVNALHLTRRVPVYPMPSVGRVGFAVEGGVQIHDVHTGVLLATARAPRIRQTRVPDGRMWLVVRDHDGNGPNSLSSFVAATADGRHLVGTTHLDGPVVTVWDLQDPRAVVDLPVATRIAVVALSPDDRFVAAAADADGALSLWTRAGKVVPLHVDRRYRRPRALAFSPHGDRLAAAFEDGTVDVLDTRSGRIAATVALPFQRASFLWWSPDGSRLVIDSTRQLRFEFERRPP
jgi:WD40 repeat protein